jgi:hypothetical protein
VSLTYVQQLSITLIDKAGIGLLLVLVGFWLNRMLEKTKHDLGLDATRHQLTAQSQIRFKESQLGEFYGPIYALLKQIRPLDDLWNNGKLGGTEKEIVASIRKANNKIVDIILAKSYLIRGDKIPEDYTRYLTHVAIWHAYLDDPNANWSEYRKLRESHYDLNFEKGVFKETEELKKELNALYHQYGIQEGKSD